MGRLGSGALVTMHACGSAIPSCDSDIRVFCSGAIVRTGIWGERLEVQRSGAADATDPAGGSEPRLGALRERPGGP